MFKHQFLKFLTKIAHFRLNCKPSNTTFLGLNSVRVSLHSKLMRIELINREWHYLRILDCA